MSYPKHSLNEFFKSPRPILKKRRQVFQVVVHFNPCYDIVIGNKIGLLLMQRMLFVLWTKLKYRD